MTGLQNPPQIDAAAQLGRILGHPLFQASQRLSAFLRFVVETTLAGQAEQLKEQVIGIEVLGRDTGYNPQEDPVVRIMAGRLRGKLAEYYQGPGVSDPVLIELPRGRYVPRICWRPSPAAAPSPGHRVRPAHGFSVGRAQELARLSAAFAAVAAGTGCVVTVSGDAGMGKTTFVEDFLSGIEEQAAAAWIGRGRCSERLAETDAFVPILESLESLLRGEPGNAVAPVMQSAAPVWYRQVAPAAGSATENASRDAPGASHERMRREFALFFEELAPTRPVILFLDDLHWADASTCDLLAYIGSRIARTRLLLILTYRPPAVMARHNPFPALKVDLERRSLCQEVPLPFLSREDIANYIGLQFPRNLFPENFPQVVHERTEGNPLFMTDMLRFLKDRRMLVELEGQWMLAQPVAELGKFVPAGIESMIRLKIDRLSDEDRDLLLCAAVEGIQFDSAVIAEVTTRDPADVEERLQELETVHNFIRTVGEQEFPNHAVSVRYHFVNVFYQNALYASLVPSRRAAHSAAIARTLVRLMGDRSSAIAADLALLFEAGRDSANAARYFLHAARNAVRVFAYPEAAILAAGGLRALDTLPESRERDAQDLKFSLILGMSLMASRGFAAAEVEAAHRRAREVALRLKENRHLFSALWGMHTCDINGGKLVSALAAAREMCDVAEALADPIAIVESLHALGTTLAFMGRLVEARQPLERIFATYPVDRHIFRGLLYVLDPCVTSLSMLARLLAMMGHLDQAIEKAAASVELANRLVHPPSLAYAIFWVGWIRHARGEYDESMRQLDSAMNLSREHGLALFLEWGRIVRGSALAHNGKAADGISEMRKSISRQDAMSAMLERPYCLTLLAEALVQEGAREEALALCDQAMELARGTEGRSYEAETHRIRGEALPAAGGANAEFESALRIAREAKCRLLELRAAMSCFRLTGAKTVLAEVVAGFPEGAESSVLKDARQLLS